MDNSKVVALPQQTQVQSYSNEQIALVKNMYAKGASDDELKLLMYMSNKYGLDVLTRQIWCVKFGNNPAQIYSGRDGFLEIAHRSGQFNGMESGTTGSIKDKDLKGWCRVYRKDMEHPFAVEVDFDEYTTGKNLWLTKPKTMIQKVAESQCLRKAFSISGLYSPEEMSQWEEEQKPIPPVPQKINIQAELISKGSELAKLKGWQGKELKENMTAIFKELFNKTKSSDLTDEEVKEAINHIELLLADEVSMANDENIEITAEEK